MHQTKPYETFKKQYIRKGQRYLEAQESFVKVLRSINNVAASSSASKAPLSLHCSKLIGLTVASDDDSLAASSCVFSRQMQALLTTAFHEQPRLSCQTCTLYAPFTTTERSAQALMSIINYTRKHSPQQALFQIKTIHQMDFDNVPYDKYGFKLFPMEPFQCPNVLGW